MGLTEGHWFEDEYSLSERQLERTIEDENDAYERGLRDGGAKTGWIATKFVRTFPVAGDEVLLATSDRRVISGYYAGNNGAHYVWKASRNGFVFWDDEITHWMPLPEPPKEGYMNVFCKNCAYYESEWQYCFKAGCHAPETGCCSGWKEKVEPKEG